MAQDIGQDLSGLSAILDGEIVHPGPDGRPMFYELIRRYGPFCFYAFDLPVWSRIPICMKSKHVGARGPVALTGV
jgi:hypothetical protein